MAENDPNVSPDTEKWVDSLDLGQTLFLINAFNHGDGVLSEILAYCSDKWNALSNTQRKKVAHEATDRFFTEKAYEEYQKVGARYRVKQEREEAERRRRQSDSGGNNNGGRRIILPGEEGFNDG